VPETDALLLENNPDKNLQPRSVLLRDDKSYLGYASRKGLFPFYKKVVKDGSEYFTLVSRQ
jgi:excinuclease UvrABC nuclease subunit